MQKGNSDRNLIIEFSENWRIFPDITRMICLLTILFLQASWCRTQHRSRAIVITRTRRWWQQRSGWLAFRWRWRIKKVDVGRLASECQHQNVACTGHLATSTGPPCYSFDRAFLFFVPKYRPGHEIIWYFFKVRGCIFIFHSVQQQSTSSIGWFATWQLLCN